jgi:hypothetical protein
VRLSGAFIETSVVITTRFTLRQSEVFGCEELETAAVSPVIMMCRTKSVLMKLWSVRVQPKSVRVGDPVRFGIVLMARVARKFGKRGLDYSRTGRRIERRLKDTQR